MSIRKSEIGSEYWDVPVREGARNAFFVGAHWYLSGRSALKAIIQELRGAKSVAMPAWCCESMVQPFLEAGFEVRFYPVYPRNGALVQEPRTDCDVLFVMSYFGYADKITVSHPCVVRDVTHSVFSSSYEDADYCFGSLRKWCGVWTGGCAWARDGHELPAGDAGDGGYTALRQRAMELKNRYINGYVDAGGHRVEDKGYLELFDEAEKLLDSAGIAPAAARDVELAGRLDAAFIRERRRANARMLMEAFPDWLIFSQMNERDCPLFVPVLVPDGRRDALRRYLIERDIYCPVHWPVSEVHRLDEKTAFLYDNELSLVCDQRYAEEDMGRMIDAIQGFVGER